MIEQFLNYLRFERNSSPQTVLTYEEALREFESYLAFKDSGLSLRVAFLFFFFFETETGGLRPCSLHYGPEEGKAAAAVREGRGNGPSARRHGVGG